MRFGITIRPLKRSASDQTRSTFSVAPKTMKQQTIKEAFYGTGVTSDVNITFAGTGDKGFGASYKKTVDLAHARSFVAAGYEGAVLVRSAWARSNGCKSRVQEVAPST